MDLESASEVIDQALHQIGDQAKVWRKLSSVKLISSSNLVKAEQKLQEMTNMLSLNKSSVDRDAMLKSNTNHEYRASSPFNKADITEVSIMDDLHTDLITNITHQHHQKIHNSPRIFLLKNWEVIIQKRKASIPFSLRVYYVLAEDDAIFRAVSLGNLDEVLLLFTHRKASPFVRDVNGCSLLHVTSFF
ncbi:unnamed protein product [Clonostachys solani]|uniref:Uncharacterized protein n=1 Tax=Clonostachys solani TaxID=160281 RepID=A0A9N9Z292_9HYPO|nr:unnamed protein product [Clonostachys solani]